MARAWIVLAFAVSVSPAYAQVTYDGCVDFRGIPVASVLNNAIPDVAAARVVQGQPVIYYNTVVLSWLPPQTRLFFYAHECAHHTLAHLARGNLGTMEQEADCWGVRELYRHGLLDDGDVATIQSSLKLSPGDWTHLPGPYRAINLAACLGVGAAQTGRS